MNNTPSELIMGFLKGSLQTDEKDRFYDWVNASAENKEIYFEAKAIYDASLHTHKTADVDLSWQRFIKKKQAYSSPTQTYSIWRNIRAYAAVAILAIAATSVFFMIQETEVAHPVAEYIGGDGLEADKIVLADGTQISLGARTTFSYAEDYGNKNRTVYLEGEAYFDVAKEKNKPFIVKTASQTIEVLGTKFNVTAYASDSVATTTLLEGSVRLMSDDIEKGTVLTPNQQYIYNKNSNTATIAEVDASLYTRWISGYYHFPDERLDIILERLGHIYGFEFEIRSSTLKQKKFTGTFYRGQSIADILEIVNLSIPIKYQINKQHVIINQ